MLNLYDTLRTNPGYQKLEVGGLLFAEYTCGVKDQKLPLWTETDYLTHVVTGKKTWHTSDGVWRAQPGQTLYLKKGATIVEQHFEEDVCLLMFFIPDAFVRTTVRNLASTLQTRPLIAEPIRAASWVENEAPLMAFFHSMRWYLSGPEKPSETLLHLKWTELVVSLLTSTKNAPLAAHLRGVADLDSPSVRETMEANYRYNLSMEEYAKLCHRSLSSFKRAFEKAFQEPPGRWLLRKRLDHAAALLRASSCSVTEVAFESGFEDVSHFSRAFKQRFQVTPVAFRHSSPPAS